jgi:hypothetical protein
MGVATVPELSPDNGPQTYCHSTTARFDLKAQGYGTIKRLKGSGLRHYFVDLKAQGYGTILSSKQARDTSHFAEHTAFFLVASRLLALQLSVLITSCKTCTNKIQLVFCVALLSSELVDDTRRVLSPIHISTARLIQHDQGPSAATHLTDQRAWRTSRCLP